MFERSVGKKPVPYIASSRTSTGGSTGVKPCSAEPVEREAVEREREQRGVADQVAEARAGEARGALHVEAADLGVLLEPPRAAAARPTRRDLDGVLLRRCRPATDSCGRVRHLGEQLVARRLGGGELLLGRAAARSFTCCSSSSCSGVGLPLSFVCPRSSSTCGTSARQRSSASSSASKASAAPLRASAARKASGSLRAALRSIMASSLGGPRSPGRRPPPRRTGRSSRRAPATASCAFATATP